MITSFAQFNGLPNEKFKNKKGNRSTSYKLHNPAKLRTKIQANFKHKDINRDMQRDETKQTVNATSRETIPFRIENFL